MSTSGSGGDYDEVLSRRQYVALAGATGAAALAGCSGGDDSGADVEDVGDIEHPDARHTGVTSANPGEVQFNQINSENPPQIAHHLLFEQFAQYNYHDNEYKPAGLEDWDFESQPFELIIREGLTWSDGEPVTAEDLVTQFRIAEADGASMWNWAEDVAAVDERTVEITVSERINPALVRVDVFEQGLGMIQQDAATYGDMLDEDGIDGVRSFADDEPVTNGPFTLADRDESILLAQRNPDHPDAENVNFGEYAFESLGENNARKQALNQLDVDSDFSVAVATRVVEDFPDDVEEVRIPDVFGIGLTPNHSHLHAGDRAVRQAIAYVVDRDLVVQNSLPRAKLAPEIPTGIPSQVQEDWLGDEIDAYESYGRDAQRTDRAAEVLEAAGYEQVEGTWQDGDGNVVSLPITVPGDWDDWVLAAETAAEHLGDFGFDAEIRSTGDYFGDLQTDDFVLIANTWLHGGPTTYPYKSLLHQLWEPQQHVARYDYPGAMDSESIGGGEEQITVPARDGDGDLTVDTQERVQALSRAEGEDEAREIVRELAWVANQDLPMIPLAEKRLQMWLTGDEWAIPESPEEEPEANVQYAPTWLPRTGLLNYQG